MNYLKNLQLKVFSLHLSKRFLLYEHIRAETGSLSRLIFKLGRLLKNTGISIGLWQANVISPPAILLLNGLSRLSRRNSFTVRTYSKLPCVVVCFFFRTGKCLRGALCFPH